MRKILIIIGTLLVAILLVLGACAPMPTSTPIPTPTPAPLEPTPGPTPTLTPAPKAKFEVMSLVVTPREVTVGETVNIEAVVKNIGSGEGTYAVTLTVDGASVETKEMSITPGSSKVVTFSLVKDAPGTYEIGIGQLSSSLTVEEKLVVKEVELKYELAKTKTFLTSDGGGYLVDFTPPSEPFTIQKVCIIGLLSGGGCESKDFEVEIWDKDCEVLHSEAYPVTKFAAGAVTLVEVEIPDVEVNGKFYVHIYTGTRFGQCGICIGAVQQEGNEHSELTIRTTEGVTEIRTDWPWATDRSWFHDKSRVNWKIRVIGTAMLPPD